MYTISMLNSSHNSHRHHRPYVIRVRVLFTAIFGRFSLENLCTSIVRFSLHPVCIVFSSNSMQISMHICACWLRSKCTGINCHQIALLCAPSSYIDWEKSQSGIYLNKSKSIRNREGEQQQYSITVDIININIW